MENSREVATNQYKEFYSIVRYPYLREYSWKDVT